MTQPRPQAIPQEISLETSDGLLLEGILQVPPGERGNAVVLCHPHPGLGGTMRTPLVTRLATGLVASGRPVVRFNFRGVGHSRGEQTEGEKEPLDVAAAVAFARTRLGRDRPSLVGWSFGALMAVAYAGTDADLAALVAIAPPLGVMAPAEGLDGATAPTLWLVGDRDPYCKPEAIEALPGSHAVIRGANHFFWVKEDVLLADVVEFLEAAGA